MSLEHWGNPHNIWFLVRVSLWWLLTVAVSGSLNYRPRTFLACLKKILRKSPQEMKLWARHSREGATYAILSISLNLHSFKAECIFGNSQKSFGAKSWDWGGFSMSNRFYGQKLLDREGLVSWSTVMVENPIVGPKFRTFLFIRTASRNRFNTSTYE